MKKYLVHGALTLLGGLFVASCAEKEGEFLGTAQQKAQAFEEVFAEVFGAVAPDQDWGFDNAAVEVDLDDESVIVEATEVEGEAAGARAATRGFFSGTRSQSAPSVPDINAPYNESWVTTYKETAKEPDGGNTTDNYDNTTYATNYGEGGANSIDWNDPDQVKDRNYFFGDDGNQDSWETKVAWALEHHPTWLTYNADETYVTNFKITGTYTGTIKVAASEGLTDGNTRSHAERTIVVTGTWNIDNNQTIGSLGKIIIAKGGTVNVADGKTLNMVNQARLVVLRGGTLTGKGKVEVNNGNASGLENYNGGTIKIGTFNNNFGKFYNYGEFYADEYQGGAQESNFYNHELVNIKNFGGSTDNATANARVFNACQFYVQQNARIRNYEGVNGSALIVDGQLLCSSSEDGTNTPTYVGLAQGALVKCKTLYNNGTSWSGPTSGYAGLEITDKIVYLNWVQDHPEQGGYFENNICVKAGDWGNVPDGNGMQQKTDNGTEYYTMSKADYKFFSIVANCRGNNGVKKVNDGGNQLIPASEGFQKGKKGGCTPGFTTDTDDTPVTPPEGSTPHVPVVSYEYPTENEDVWRQYENGRVFCEDLGQTSREDLDFNDVVFDATIWSRTTKVITYKQKYVDGVKSGSKVFDHEEIASEPNAYYAHITLLAAGGTIPLLVEGREVHDLFGVGVTTMVNTNDANTTAFGSFAERNPVDVTNSESTTKTFKDENGTQYTLNLIKGIKHIKDIQIVSSFNNTAVLELKTEVGKAPHKILVPQGTPWTVERKNINLGYPDFANYVKGSISQTWVNNKDTYYLCVGNKPSPQEKMPRAIRTTTVVKNETLTVLWEGQKTFGSSWSLSDLDQSQFSIDRFYPGDRLRLYGTGFGEENWVNVTLSDSSTPYIIDSEFAQLVKGEDGSYSYPGTSMLEVVLDENGAARLNRAISNGKIVFQVQGRNFTLTQIARVLFQ